MSPDLQPGVSVNLEQHMQLQTLQELRGLAGQVRDLRTIMMGSGEGGETPYGRIPMLESRLGKAEAAVQALEAAAVAARAYWNSARIVGHLLTALGGGAVAEAFHLLLHSR